MSDPRGQRDLPVLSQQGERGLRVGGRRWRGPRPVPGGSRHSASLGRTLEIWPDQEMITTKPSEAKIKKESYHDHTDLTKGSL